MIIKSQSHTIVLDILFVISAVALIHLHITSPQTRRKLSIAEQQEIIDHKRSRLLTQLSEVSRSLDKALGHALYLEEPYKTKALVALTALRAEEALLNHRLQLPSRCQWLKGSMRHQIRLYRFNIYTRRIAQLKQLVDRFTERVNNT